jgi:hypothetical protein
MHHHSAEAVDAAVQLVWDFHQLGHEVVGDPTFVAGLDGILVFCSSDVSVAQAAADLWVHVATARLTAVCGGSDGASIARQGDGGAFAAAENTATVPYLLFSGGHGTGPHSGANLLGWTEPEATVLSALARDAIAAQRPDLLPHLRLLVEPRARNSGENAQLSRELLTASGLPAPQRLVVVQKPFMERRTFATLLRQWPGLADVRMCSARVAWRDYPAHAGVPRDVITGIMLGDLQRCRLYAPPYGDFQVAQHIPDNVWNAFEFLTYDPEVRARHPEYAVNLMMEKPTLTTTTPAAAAAAGGLGAGTGAGGQVGVTSGDRGGGGGGSSGGGESDMTSSDGAAEVFVEAAVLAAADASTGTSAEGGVSDARAGRVRPT